MSKTETDTKDAASQGSMILVVVNGTIYEIGEDYAWMKEGSGLYGMGSGGEYAVAVLHALMPPKGKLTVDAAKELVKEALTIAAKLDNNSGGPFNIIIQEAE